MDGQAYDAVQMENPHPLRVMDADQLLSRLVLADRDDQLGDFVKCREELMYRLRCAEPLINWSKPTRRDK